MKKLFIMVIVTILSIQVFPTHFMGGEITWQCLPNGNYRFTMKLYRECYMNSGGNAATFGATETLRTTAPGFATITMHRTSLLDMSPVCNSSFTPRIFCPGMSGASANMGALQENIYTSDVSFPNGVPLTGTPPLGGWIFFHQSGDRNPSTNVIGSGTMSWRLRSVMYPYTPPGATAPLPANPCYDSSPVFAERPSTVICMGYPFAYSHNAYDSDLDSLAYAWGNPLLSGGANIVSYAAGYSAMSPLPGTAHNPANVPATVDPITGEISFTSFTQGAFITCSKVSAYRCGQLIAEIYREMQVVLLSCGNIGPGQPNEPPIVSAPFPLNPNPYFTQIYAGQPVAFSISATDFQMMPGGTVPQTITLNASGGQFGAGYTNPNAGCAFPPCATLTPPPPVSAQFAISSIFNWQTSCDHLAVNAGCNSTTNRFTFLIRVQDDFCPAPAIKFNTVTVEVIDTPPIDAPQLTCIETLDNGNVVLNWIPPVEPYPLPTFREYVVYFSPNLAFPFTAVDTISSYTQTSWTHNTPNGNNAIGYYYMRTFSGCGSNPSVNTSDTISNILLNVTNPGTGVAELNWNASHTPLLPHTSPIYLIYREAGTGVWSLIDSTTTLTYIDTITNCNTFINYRIMQYNFADSTGCYSRSNIDGDLFSDVTAPDTPLLDTVSVNVTDQLAEIGWQSSNAGDVVGYIIYHFAGGIWNPIDTIVGNYYMHALSNPTANFEAYRIASIDSCGNTSPMGLEHRTIFLTTQKDICDNKIILNWTPYMNMGASLSHYDIYVAESGNPYVLLGTVPANTNTFDHFGLIDGAEVCYTIVAVNDDSTKTSSSNEACDVAGLPFQPQFAYIPYVTVVNNQHVEIALHTDINAVIRHYRLEKSTDNGLTFTQLALIPPSAVADIYYEDFNVSVDGLVYNYRFIVVDSCGIDALESNIASTILLEGELGTEMFSNIVSWTDYNGWPGGVEWYNLYRGTSSDINLSTNVAQVPPGIGFFIDNFPDDIAMSEGKISYYVEAIEAIGNPLGFVEKSRSNVIFIPQPPRVYVPNAFAPQGQNPEFKPMTIFVDHQNYYFAVFNRWGEKLFETTDMAKGWDGRHKGEYVKPDTYVYTLKVQFATGKPFEKRGVVTVVR